LIRLLCTNTFESHDFTYPDLKDAPKGDATKGKALAASCAGCHSIKVEGIKAPMDPLTAAQTYGVNPPDLSSAGELYSEKFLVAFLQNPQHTTKVKKFAMPQSAGSAQDAADIVAYLKSIAPKAKEELKKEAEKLAQKEAKALEKEGHKVSEEGMKKLTEEKLTKLEHKDAFENACGRCHAMRYG